MERVIEDLETETNGKCYVINKFVMESNIVRRCYPQRMITADSHVMRISSRISVAHGDLPKSSGLRHCCGNII